MRVFIAVLALVCAMSSGRALAQSLDARERREVVLGAANLIEQRYVYPDRGLEIAMALRNDENRFTETDAEAFAATLTARLREISADGHFAVEYRAEDPAAVDNQVTEEAHLARMMDHWYGKGVNHGFESVQRLAGGVGYLDLRVFAPTETAADMMQAAMTLLAQSPALIIDLRQNGGGMGEMGLMLEGYLLDQSTEVSGTYDRPSDRFIRSFTPSWVPGRRFGGDKPVFILISGRTFSAAEAFAYDMQAIGRARIVGETSGGGAHPFQYRAINRRFVLSLPEGRSINPVTGGDWQGVGVRPDVPTAPEDALSVALELASKEIAAQAPAAASDPAR